MLTQAETKIWRSLRRRKGRAATGLFLAEGLRVVAELVTEQSVKAVLLCAKSARNQTIVIDLLEQAMDQGHRVEVVSDVLIDSIADAMTPQPLLAIAEVPERSWDDIESGLILVLDSVQDPGNVGTLIRTAAAVGAAGVIGVGTAADPWGPKAVRASAGAVLKVPVLRADTSDTLIELKRRGVPLWIASADGESIGRFKPSSGCLALALGSEATGVSPELRAEAVQTVSVRMTGGVESLNVAAAGAILLDRLTGD
jgi:TrmH family RNA methyltransferase